MTVTPLAAVAAGLLAAWMVAAALLGPRLGPLVGREIAGANRRPGRAGTAAVARPPVNPVDVGAALVTAALLVLVGMNVAGPARVLAALAFVSFVPGWALLGVLPLIPGGRTQDWSARGAESLVRGVPKLALAVAMSLSLSAGATQSLLWLHVWHPVVLLWLLGGISLLALAWRLARPRAVNATLLP